MFLKDRDVRLKFRRALICYRRSDFKKCWIANRDHSVHYLKFQVNHACFHGGEASSTQTQSPFLIKFANQHI